MAATVRASCERCGVRFEWAVPLGASIMRHLDKLILWVRNEHTCTAIFCPVCDRTTTSVVEEQPVADVLRRSEHNVGLPGGPAITRYHPCGHRTLSPETE